MCIWNMYLFTSQFVGAADSVDKAIELPLNFYPFPYSVSVINQLVETDIVPTS